MPKFRYKVYKVMLDNTKVLVGDFSDRMWAEICERRLRERTFRDFGDVEILTCKED